MLPYAPGLALVLLLGPSLGDAERAGLLAVAVSPAVLAAPALATALAGRMDRAAALLVGTIAVSFILVLTCASGAGPTLQRGMVGFAIGAGVTSVAPMLPAAVRTAVQRLGDVAFVVLIAVAIVGGASLGPLAAFAAIAFVAATAGGAVLVARIGGVDVGSAIAGAGTRDPAVAIAFALTLGGPSAAGVPLYSALLLLVLGAALVARNRRKAR